MKQRIPDRIRAELRGEELVAQLFKDHGWKLKARLDLGPYEPDLLVQKGGRSFILEVKAASEGRPDRVLPALSQALLQSQAYAHHHGKARPMAIVYVREASPSLLKHVERFVEQYAPGQVVGVLDERGLRRFYGDGFEDLNAEPPAAPGASHARPGRAAHLFSDLNQWMLKVLLAPEIPERLLHAPRGQYANVSQLAKAARVSVMSAFRFQQQLLDEQFLDDSGAAFRLVRRRELFRRWQADSLSSVPREMAMAFLIRGDPDKQLRKLLDGREACLALFAAADALRVGHVRGVPPYAYVRKVPAFWNQHQDQLFPSPAERPNLILRQAPAPESIFRGMVDDGAVGCADILQVWLDVSAHPSRGEEQADLIYRSVLKPIVEGAAD